jgi:hypothetical protein
MIKILLTFASMVVALDNPNRYQDYAIIKVCGSLDNTDCIIAKWSEILDLVNVLKASESTKPPTSTVSIKPLFRVDTAPRSWSEKELELTRIYKQGLVDFTRIYDSLIIIPKTRLDLALKRFHVARTVSTLMNVFMQDPALEGTMMTSLINAAHSYNDFARNSYDDLSDAVPELRALPYART